MVKSVERTAAFTSHSITLRQAFWVWLKVAVYSFGGPAGQIAVMHRLLVEEKKWVSENRFLHALNYAMLLPGPEAQQLATYIGWLLHRTVGGLMAGTLFVLPGFISIMVLSILYAGFQEVTAVQGLFYGLKPAVMAVVMEAVVRIGRRALKNRVMIGLAALAFVAIFFFDVLFPLIVLGAGVIGFAGGRLWPVWFQIIKGDQTHEETAVISDNMGTHTRPTLRWAVQVLVICLALWWGPLLVLAWRLGPDNVFTTIGVFFSKTAVVTFGGAYAVLAYVAQQAVDVFGWLQPGEMLDGLGMAETTPGPLIQVLQFVGFMGAYRQPGNLTPMMAGILGSILTTWVTYVPCFLWIFLGAPYIEYLRGNRDLSAALSAITASVVGVILNLAVWFSLHTVFAVVDERTVGPVKLSIPQSETADLVSLFIAISASIALFRFKVSMLLTLAGSAVAGLIYYLFL
jgi:chromate transporter